MHSTFLGKTFLAFLSTTCAWAQQPSSCAKLANFKPENVEITKAVVIAAGTTEPIPWNQTRSAPLPAYCRVEGVMNRRTGVDGEEFGITFALAMPDKWNGDFLMQGGGGSNGIVLAPLGLNAAGETPALMRGFAVVSTDSGHKSHHPGFDFDFRRDQQHIWILLTSRMLKSLLWPNNSSHNTTANPQRIRTSRAVPQAAAKA
ncbi:MAG TPA: tannase/feruloyl esterase family alpha/beta hydrolase [Candidatus Sulfotelmatobacter sp.]|nr:tannase/feruloyl esterase family alpha/beta hydrolase [Candidatus Sulfotelmatobacter sp.]